MSLVTPPSCCFMTLCMSSISHWLWGDIIWDWKASMNSDLIRHLCKWTLYSNWRGLLKCGFKYCSVILGWLTTCLPIGIGPTWYYSMNTAYLCSRFPWLSRHLPDHRSLLHPIWVFFSSLAFYHAKHRQLSMPPFLYHCGQSMTASPLPPILPWSLFVHASMVTLAVHNSCRIFYSPKPRFESINFANTSSAYIVNYGNNNQVFWRDICGSMLGQDILFFREPAIMIGRQCQFGSNTLN